MARYSHKREVNRIINSLEKHLANYKHRVVSSALDELGELGFKLIDNAPKRSGRYAKNFKIVQNPKSKSFSKTKPKSAGVAVARAKFQIEKKIEKAKEKSKRGKFKGIALVNNSPYYARLEFTNHSRQVGKFWQAKLVRNFKRKFKQLKPARKR